MDLRFNTSLAEGYKSGSQIARLSSDREANCKISQHHY